MLKKVNIKTTRHNRTDLADMFGELGFKRGAEIGVRRGDYSETLCTHIKSLEKLYSVDPWNLVFEDPISNQHQRKYGPDVFNRYYRMALRRLKKYPVCELVRNTSLEAVRNIEYGSLDFVYIDGAHTFDYVMTDIIEWSKRVRKSGIVSGDDYKENRYDDVITPVNTSVRAHNIEVLNIMKPAKDDEYTVPTWWFTKI